MQPYKKLYRSEDNKIFAGIAGGIGEYFNIDPVLIRILWVLFSFSSGGGAILFYIVLIFIIPKRLPSQLPL